MEILEPDRIERVRKKLDAIFEALVEEHGMKPSEVNNGKVENFCKLSSPRFVSAETHDYVLATHLHMWTHR